MEKKALSKEAISEQQKFFRLCSEDYKSKLIGKEKMSIADFNDITMILYMIGFHEYYDYVLLRFSGLFQSAVDLENHEDYLAVDADTYVDLCNEVLQKFVDGIESKRLKSVYEEILLS